jgi:hypothetical protein
MQFASLIKDEVLNTVQGIVRGFLLRPAPAGSLAGFFDLLLLYKQQVNKQY